MRSGSLTTCLIKPKAATDSLKDVLIRLARQKKSGRIVLDGRKSISKLPMINFSFHAESRSYKENTDIFSTQTLCSKWTRMSGGLLGFGPGEDGKTVPHDFATRGTSQPVSIGSAERCWKAYTNIRRP